MAVAFPGVAAAAVNADNAAVAVTLPAGYAAGDLIVIACSYKSGAGTLSIDNGFSTAFDDNNSTATATERLAVYWKIATSASEGTTTITPAGGSAGDVLLAQSCYFTGTDTTTPFLEVGTKFQSATQTANIGAITGIAVVADHAALVVAGRSDDWTSVSTLTADTDSYVEIGEPDTTTGNDCGLVWNYMLVTGARTLANRTFTVTGGSGWSVGVFLEIQDPTGGAATLYNLTSTLAGT